MKRPKATLDVSEAGDGGLQRQRVPGQKPRKMKPVQPAPERVHEGGDTDAAADKLAMDQARAAGRVQQQGVQRAHAMNQGRGRDLVPGI